MIAINDPMELKATITAISGDNFDIAISEIFVDAKWEKLKIPKPLNVLLSDYDTTILTDTEKALAKAVIAKAISTLTGDYLITATSLNAKL